MPAMPAAEEIARRAAVTVKPSQPVRPVVLREGAVAPKGLLRRLAVRTQFAIADNTQEHARIATMREPTLLLPANEAGCPVGDLLDHRLRHLVPYFVIPSADAGRIREF